ncbi:MAG: N-acetylmuramoyl-L-alanine amidase [Propionibacteriaceae bacterium]|jgi:N-acetylmuramoyl-L-alanine amidase|nr:N-acetylmuramoyl-L-alanine amidase [Propionibacteriaceae bacterium]
MLRTLKVAVLSLALAAGMLAAGPTNALGDSSSARVASPARTAGAEAKPLTGKLIVVDPGHNGKYSAKFATKQVPAGNGKKKNCQASGTATNDGYAEHAFNWDTAKRLKAQLEAQGAKVVLTRSNDRGYGPCVDERAKIVNRNKADLLISIHADGASAKARGFHIIVSTTMAGGNKLEKKSLALAKAVRARMAKTKMPKSNYIGSGTALSKRSDIAGLNLLKQTPGIMLETGNMRNKTDAKLLKSKTFRQSVAVALRKAAVDYLG